MSVTVILGEQRGDEGKGRFVDMIAEKHDIVARFNGGNNAGHTVVLPDERVLKLHQLPSGIAHPHAINVIGNGCLLNPVKLVEEIEQVEKQGIKVTPKNLKISTAAHLVMPYHISADEIREAGKGRQGSTKSGIAQVSSDKYSRSGFRLSSACQVPEKLRVTIIEKLQSQSTTRKAFGLTKIDEQTFADEYIKALQILSKYSDDTVIYLNKALKNNKRILAEGAQAFQLDIDHGMYPFTTSSSTTAGAVATGLGIAPSEISRVIGVSKAVQSHVGGGPFVTEIEDDDLLTGLHGDRAKVDAEYGTTTGRLRRLGYLDLPGIRRAQLINGTGLMALTKLDWVPRYGKKIKICVAYKLDGKTIEIAPDSAELLSNCQPIYNEVESWDENISTIRDYEDLPKNTKNYIEFIENKLQAKINLIGIGPGREEVIVRGNI